MSEQPAAPMLPDAPTLPAWRPFKGPMQRWPRVFDVVFALLALVATAVAWGAGRGGERHFRDLSAAALVAIVVGSGALFWRRRWPVRAHWVVVGSSCLALFAGTGSGLFAMAFSLYSLGRYAPSTRASVFGFCGSLLFVARDLFVPRTPGTGSVAAAVLVLGLWYLGRQMRFRGEYLRLLEERAAHLEARRKVEAEKAVAEERTRIARELHDIVAHQVSLMTVQAGAAKTVAATAPEAAIEAMGAVEKAGRQALGELRHLLGVLRPDCESPHLGPQPGVADLPRLVKELEGAGLAVALSVRGSVAELPARVELAVYRIVQEALTNVLKHAGPSAAARVLVAVQRRAVELTVEDDGSGRCHLPGSGHGIAGMRERAQLLGGSLAARALPQGGFRVEAHLPLSADPSSSNLRYEAEQVCAKESGKR